MYRIQHATIGLIGLTFGSLGACTEKEHAPYLGARVTHRGGAGGASGESSDAGSVDAVGGSGGASGLRAEGSALVGVFAHEGGLLVVDESAVRNLSWTGELLGTWAALRPLTSADFDGTNLVVSDSAVLTTLDLSLTPIVEAQVIEACEFVVTVSGNRVVCGPSVDWDRTFYTYDSTVGTLLATAEPMTYHGVPMRRVYGSDAFLSVTMGSSPTDFYYHKVDPSTNAVVFYSDSPYHGDFGIDMRFGYVGSPATHVVTYEGLMLRIEGADCVPGANPTTCLMKDGNLGTLPADSDASYLALSDAPSGTMYTLVSAQSYPSGCYEQTCELQKVDVATRLVLDTRIIQTSEDMTDFYLVPSYDGSGVVLVSSGRSIYGESFDDSLRYTLAYLRF